MKFKNYIWDFDGTLYDTYDFITNSMQEALRENGIEPNFEHLHKLIRLSINDVVSYYSTMYDIKPERISESYKKFSHNIDFEKTKPFEKIPEILKFIAENNGQNFIYTHRGKTTDKMLDFYDLKKYFVEVVDSTYDFPRKPEPEGAIYLIEKYKLDREKTIFLGDRELDILCGKNAGIKSCLFAKKQITFECDYYLNDYNKFKDLFF